MKKLLFSLLAIVMLSFTSNAQNIVSHNDAKKIAAEHNKFLESLLKTNPSNIQNVNDFFADLNFENVSEQQKQKYFTTSSYEHNLLLLKKHIDNSTVFENINNCNIIIEN
jgi:hypothetical protein